MKEKIVILLMILIVFALGSTFADAQFVARIQNRLVVPAYPNQILRLYYILILPVPVIGIAENFDLAALKTDAYYGNPLSGFAVQ